LIVLLDVSRVFASVLLGVPLLLPTLRPALIALFTRLFGIACGVSAFLSRVARTVRSGEVVARPFVPIKP